MGSSIYNHKTQPSQEIERQMVETLNQEIILTLARKWRKKNLYTNIPSLKHKETVTVVINRSAKYSKVDQQGER